VRRPIGLRVNPAIAAGFHAHVMAGAADGKFGIALDDVLAAAGEARRLGLDVQGLHAHLGSDVLDAQPHEQLVRLLAGLAEHVPSVRWINVGGGFGTPRRDGDATYPWEALSSVAGECLALADGRRLELRVEPGGYLSMDAGVVLGRVIAIKAGSAGRPETVVTNVSTNQLVSVLLYDAHHALRLLGRDADDRPRRYRVAGNLMQAGDVLAVDVELPEVLPGDLLVVGHAGAYAASRAGTFNQRPRAAEVLLDGDEAVLLRRAETVDELFARDWRPAL
jgi:diaminopimelate decarboxylase